MKKIIFQPADSNSGSQLAGACPGSSGGITHPHLHPHSLRLWHVDSHARVFGMHEELESREKPSRQTWWKHANSTRRVAPARNQFFLINFITKWCDLRTCCTRLYISNFFPSSIPQLPPPLTQPGICSPETKMMEIKWETWKCYPSRLAYHKTWLGRHRVCT